MRLALDTPTLADALDLATHMRDADRAEIARGSGRDVLKVVLDSICRSVECRVARIDNRVMAIWGVGSDGSGTIMGPRHGVAWLLTTRVVDEYPKTFWRTCKTVLPDLLRRWDRLTNAIDGNHHTALRWVRRLGFMVAERPMAWGVSGHPFYLCSITAGGAPCVN